MPLTDDIISVLLVQEIAGVQVGNRQYFKVDDPQADPTVLVGLGEYMTHFHDAVKTFLTADWALVCATYENLTTPEGKTVLFNTLPGESAGSSHPQDQVLRFNEYYRYPTDGKVKRGAHNQSGVNETLSARGRLNNNAAVSGLTAFLRDQVDLGPGNWLITPQLRHNVGTIPAPVYAFGGVERIEVSSAFHKLGSRRAKLCAVA